MTRNYFSFLLNQIILVWRSRSHDFFLFLQRNLIVIRFSVIEVIFLLKIASGF